MTPEERLQKIESYGNAHALLVEALEEFPEEMRQWRDEHGCWSVHEHLVHVTDSEVNSYVRCRRLIAEQGGTIMAYDENKWASLLNYHDQSIGDALASVQAAAPTELHADQDAARTRLVAYSHPLGRRRDEP